VCYQVYENVIGKEWIELISTLLNPVGVSSLLGHMVFGKITREEAAKFLTSDRGK
jgi:hypothetical protein